MKNFKLSTKYATNMGDWLKKEAERPEADRNPFIEWFREFNKTAKFNPATSYMWSRYDESWYENLYKNSLKDKKFTETFSELTDIIRGVCDQIHQNFGELTEEVWYDIIYEGNRLAVMFMTTYDVWVVQDIAHKKSVSPKPSWLPSKRYASSWYDWLSNGGKCYQFCSDCQKAGFNLLKTSFWSEFELTGLEARVINEEFDITFENFDTIVKEIHRELVKKHSHVLEDQFYEIIYKGECFAIMRCSEDQHVLLAHQE